MELGVNIQGTSWLSLHINGYEGGCYSTHSTPPPQICPDSYILTTTGVMCYYVPLTNSIRVIANVEETISFLCSFDGHFLKQSMNIFTSSPLQFKGAVWIALFLFVGQT